MKRYKRLFILISLLSIMPSLASALEVEGLQLNAGNVIILNAEPVEISPAPDSASPMFGVSVPMYFTDLFYFEPGLRFYSFPVIIDGASSRPVPAALETADRISVLGIEIRPELGAAFSLSEKIQLGFTAAPAVSLRIPVEAHDAAGETETDAVLNYYLSSARFLSLYAGGFLTWSFTESAALRFRIGTNLPVYNLWDGEDSVFYDHLAVVPELGILWRF